MRRAKIIKLKYKTLIIKHLKNKLHFFKKSFVFIGM
jgi:phosphate starvation-inducible membrane PsiE